MTRPLLVLRPEPGATKTARAAAMLGMRAVIAPLFEVRAVAWDVPDPAAFDALLLTSANAARYGGVGLQALATLPVYAIGPASADAARAASLSVRAAGDGDAVAALALAAADGATRLLHLAGREHRDAHHPGLQIVRRIVYASDPVHRLPDAAAAALSGGAVALLHSPRAAALFAALVGDAGLMRDMIAVAALSEAVAAASGSGWQALAIAAHPTDDALLAAAARLCDG